MSTDDLSTAGLSAKVHAIVGKVQQTLRRETGEDHDPRLIEDSITACVVSALGRFEENMLEIFTTPGRREYDELLSVIERNRATAMAAVEVEEMAYIAQEHRDESIFNGHRPFSKAKMAAMIEHLTSKANNVYKTSLNKLLFYSDLTMFYLSGHGISGAMYANRPYGPVSASAEPLLNELVGAERIKVNERTKTLASSAEPADVLSPAEQKVLEWVARTYGHMSASEISDHSHREMAYKYTDANEPIAYAYGKFFKHLPPKGLLDN